MEVLDPIVRAVCEAGVPMDTMWDRDSLSFMHRAIALGELDRLDEFREDVNATDCFGLTPLHYAVLLSVPWQSHAARELIKLGADPGLVSNGGAFNPLHLAAQRGNSELVELFLKETSGLELDTSTTRDGSALCLACKSQSLDAAEALVSAGADVNISDAQGLTPLHLVCRDLLCGSGSSEKLSPVAVFIRLLSKGTGDQGLQVNAVDSQGRTALHIAALVGNRGAIEYLLELKADVSMRDMIGRTALHYASCGVVVVKDFGFVKSLMAAGSDLQVRDKRGLSPSDCFAAVMKSRSLSRGETTALSVARSLIEKELEAKKQLLVDQAQADANAEALLAEESLARTRKKK